MTDFTGVQLGDFEILRELGRGGMGIVYEALQTSLNRRVALKVLGSGLGLTPRAVDRFRREAAAAAKLHHTNIVPVYATGDENGIHFYAMEQIDGPSLDAVIRDMRGEDVETKSELPANLATTGAYIPASSTPAPASGGSATGLSAERFDRAAAMIADVADALHHAHQQGVTHRDIKPSNLLLSSDGRLSVTDFGLARMLEQPGMTVTGEFVGTPAYMSPEQITAGRIPVDHRTDIYSLGATLYELLTLAPPFKADGRDKLLAMVIQKDPRPPRSIAPKIPRDLETICLKCLEKDPDRRYQTSQELAADLRRYVNRFAILAKRAGPLMRIRKWFKRNPAVSAAGLTLLLAVGAAGFFAWRAHESESRRKAEELRQAEELAAEKRRAAIERGMAAALGADLAAAEKTVAEAELLGASAGETRLLRGFIAFYNGRSMEAVDHFKQAAQLMPESVSARALYASALLSIADWPAAQQALNEAKELTPRTPEDKLFLGYALGAFRPAEGLRKMDEGLAERPSGIGHVLRAGLRDSLARETGTVADAEANVVDAELAKRLLPGNPYSFRTALDARLTAYATFRRLGIQDKAKEQLASAAEEAEALAKFPKNELALKSRLHFVMILDGLNQSGEMHEAIEKLRSVNAGPYTTFLDSYDLFCRGLDTQAWNAGSTYPKDRLAGHLRILAALNRPDGLTEARNAWNLISGPDRFVHYRMETAPLLFVIGGADEVAKFIANLKSSSGNLEPVRFSHAAFDGLLSFLEGNMSEVDLLNSRGISQFETVRLYVYVGLKHLGAGDRTGAKAMFEKAYDSRMVGSLTWTMARGMLIRMKNDPAWPRAIPRSP